MEQNLVKDFEETYLEQVVQRIKAEIVGYVDKRKSIVGNILDYRKTAIEEFRDDEDKLIEYFDHEKFIYEQTFTTIDKRIKELVVLETSPYFGKVNFKEEDEDLDEHIYIGRFGFIPHGEYEPLVVDWRAPVASLFYGGKLGAMKYKAPMGDVNVDVLARRQFVIKKAKLLGMFDSSVDVKDEMLQLALSSNTSEKLKDIVMTIQSEQDEIIRQGKNKTVVVNGVAGSGKTTIALHRIAYLLYNYRKELSDKVMILGPNYIFMEYISRVLPTLGEEGIVQKTFPELAMEILGIEEVEDLKGYMEKIVSGDKEFIETSKRKTSVSFIEELDDFIASLSEKQYKFETIKYDDIDVITKDELDNLFNVDYISMPVFRRIVKIKRIIYMKLKNIVLEKVYEINQKHQEALSKLNKDETQDYINHLDFTRKVRIKEVLKKSLDIKRTLKVYNEEDIISLYNDFNDNKLLNIDDLAPLLYLYAKFKGAPKNINFKHVVIDEAQDYSLLQFKVIKELTQCTSMTIVGDCNQRISPIDGEIPMMSLKDSIGLDVENFKLDKSYRSTAQIMKYANKYLEEDKIVPLVRDGNEVKVYDINNVKESVEIIKDTLSFYEKQDYDNIAIIVNDLNEMNEISPILKNEIKIHELRDEDVLYNGGTVLIPSYLSKGLEFDAVIVINNKLNDVSNKIKYVTATRALHELTIINL